MIVSKSGEYRALNRVKMESECLWYHGVDLNSDGGKEARVEAQTGRRSKGC